MIHSPDKSDVGSEVKLIGLPARISDQADDRVRTVALICLSVPSLLSDITTLLPFG